MTKKKMVLTISLVALVAVAILAIALVITFNAHGVALAETVLSKDGEESGTIDVTYTVQDTWTVTIPGDIVIDDESGEGTQTVTASNVKIEQGKTLTVKVTSEHTWKLEYDGQTLDYELKAGEGVAFTDNNNNVVLTIVAGTDGKSETLTATIKEDAKKFSTGGNAYTDTLTFTITIA